MLYPYTLYVLEDQNSGSISLSQLSESLKKPAALEGQRDLATSNQGSNACCVVTATVDDVNSLIPVTLTAMWPKK